MIADYDTTLKCSKSFYTPWIYRRIFLGFVLQINDINDFRHMIKLNSIIFLEKNLVFCLVLSFEKEWQAKVHPIEI